MGLFGQVAQAVDGGSKPQPPPPPPPPISVASSSVQAASNAVRVAAASAGGGSPNVLSGSQGAAEPSKTGGKATLSGVT